MEKTFNYEIEILRGEEILHISNFYTNEEQFNTEYNSIMSEMEKLETNFIILEGEDFKHKIFLKDLEIKKITRIVNFSNK